MRSRTAAYSYTWPLPTNGVSQSTGQDKVRGFLDWSRGIVLVIPLSSNPLLFLNFTTDMLFHTGPRDIIQPWKFINLLIEFF